jgi:hypothetical protein
MRFSSFLSTLEKSKMRLRCTFTPSYPDAKQILTLSFYSCLGLVTAPPGHVVIGLRFWKKNNRMAPEILCYAKDKPLIWQKNTDMGAKYTDVKQYADITSVFAPENTLTSGF